MRRYQFPKNFVWGTATSSYQVEGGADAGGRGASIWDTFARIEGKVFNGDDGSVACDHYHRYAEDFDLLRRLNVRAYRFSIAWPRIYPNGTGWLSDEGLDFYDRLVDALLERGVVPSATLYHWDLPQALEDKGGWRNRSTVKAFEEYARVVAGRLGDRVKNWFTVNEPWCAWWLGHKTGIHAPGAQESEKVHRQVSHNLLLAHGAGVLALREEVSSPVRVGLVHNCAVAIPFTESEEDIAESREFFRRENSWLLHPVLAGRYPEDQWKALGADVPEVLPGDLELISQKCDFLGINLYHAHGVARAGKGVRPYEPFFPRTDFGWPVTPECLYWAIRHVAEIWDVNEVIVTENGCAYPDEVRDSPECVEDYARVQYIREHLKGVHRAISEGLPVSGYYLWSFLDNFEWAEGYSKRFGMVHVDFGTQRRTPKMSALWFSELVSQGGF